MSAAAPERSPLVAAIALAGYRPAYQPGAICPGCGGRAWHVGRSSAECARCATALALVPPSPAERAGDGW